MHNLKIISLIIEEKAALDRAATTRGRVYCVKQNITNHYL